MNNFETIYSKRVVICYFIVVLLFFSCILRVTLAATGDYAQTAENQSSYRLTVGNIRGTIFDCNMMPITNAEKRIVAAVSPTPRAITAISQVLSGDQLETVLNDLKTGKPTICQLPEYIDCDDIVCAQIYERYQENFPAVHTIGSVNADNHGVSGLEAAYDDILYSDEQFSFVYTINGKGEILKGVPPKTENETSAAAKGVVSTLDINIQNIAESVAQNIESGAIVVADAKTSKLRAVVSRPKYNVDEIYKYLENENSPLLNRAFSAYNVGSVFKPCVAAAAIESNKGNFTYKCTGSTKIIDRYFKCHNQNGHGLTDLKLGLANSCNTYFYNLAFFVGGNKIFETASALRLSNPIKICDGIYTARGSLPKRESLNNEAYLANFSIGQGELLASPVAMLNLYCAIAYDGKYYPPSLVEGTVLGGKLTPYNKGNPTKIMESSTAKILRECLSAVITEGTGKTAMPKTVTAAGKTATAQTGKYSGGKEICQGWFCGFFPADEPQYVVIVFSENTQKQLLSCGQIFSLLADKIYELKINT